jgi:hypothetical protein
MWHPHDSWQRGLGNELASEVANMVPAGKYFDLIFKVALCLLNR